MNEDGRPRFTPVAQRVEPAPYVAAATEVEFHASGMGTQDRSDEIDLVKVLGIVWRGKWIVILFALICSVLGGFYAFEIAEPKYLSTARLVLQSRDLQLRVDRRLLWRNAGNHAFNINYLLVAGL